MRFLMGALISVITDKCHRGGTSVSPGVRISFFSQPRIVEPSKNAYDLYLSKMEAEQVRAAIQELPVEFREIILLRQSSEYSRI